MPKAKSKQQFKFLQAIAHKSIKKPGLSPAKAAEMVSHQSPKDLPKYAKLKKMIKK